MSILRRVARPLLAATFVTGGIDQLRNPEPKAPAAEDAGTPVARRLPWLPEDPVTLTRLDGGLKLVAGGLFALGRMPRLAALALAATLVPTTLGAHRFWEEPDPQVATEQRLHFLKNAGLLGGLLLAAVDTEGRPSVAWRARRAAAGARHTAVDHLPIG